MQYVGCAVEHTAVLRKLLENLISGFEAFLELSCLIEGKQLLEERALLGREAPFGRDWEGLGHGEWTEYFWRNKGKQRVRASHSTTTMVAQTRHAAQPSPKRKLAFHDKLTGKGLSTDALLKKMKTLHAELAALDQDFVDTTSLGSARKELVNTSILLHKDRGVKAYAACCLADILRLYAPDAPYTQSELRDIFQFFFRQLTNGLKGADASYYNEYFHLLESLSTVKSVVLVCDLPNAEELMSEIFRDFFNLVKRDLPKKVEIFMVDILVALIDEAQVFPNEALEVLLSQFMENNLVCLLSILLPSSFLS